MKILLFSTAFRDNDKGNALFLILIAVALFAALSYAVTRTGGGGGGSISKDKSMLLAAQITQAAADVDLGVQRLTVLGTPPDQIRGGVSALPGGGTMNGWADFCTTGATCIFAPDGGGASVPKMPREAFESSSPLDPILPNSWVNEHSYNGVLMDGFGGGLPANGGLNVGTAAPDENLEVHPLKREVCQAINAGFGIPGVPLGVFATELDKKLDYCLDWYGDGSLYIYMHILRVE